MSRCLSSSLYCTAVCMSLGAIRYGCTLYICNPNALYIIIRYIMQTPCNDNLTFLSMDNFKTSLSDKALLTKKLLKVSEKFRVGSD